MVAAVPELVAPRILSVPAAPFSLYDECVELWEDAGLFLDGWQALVMRQALGVQADAKWAAYEIGVNMPRQNGKGALLEARELAGLFVFGEQLIVHSAHLFDTSIEAFLRMEALIEEAGLIGQLKSRSGVSRSHGSEGFALKTGGRLRYRTRTKGGGRGFTIDTLIVDEAMFLPEKAMGALMPTQSAAANPQVWYTGSAVDQFVHDDGVVFARIRERGLRGDDPSLAYFEWSADRDTPDDLEERDLTDRGLWRQANPALGIRIREEHIAHEQRSMAGRTFAVERLGVGDYPPTDTLGELIIPLEEWDLLADERSTVQGPICVAFDVSPDRKMASISIAGRRPDGLLHGEITDRRRGTKWVVPRLVEIVGRNDVTLVVCDSVGPASSLVRQLEQANVKVEAANGTEYGQACGMLVDAVAESELRHLGSGEVRAAIKGAVKRPLGDAWAWSRRNSSVDITPLVAFTLAVWAAWVPEKKGVPMLAIGGTVYR